MKKILLILFFLFNIISNGQSSEKNYISGFETYNGDNSVNVVVEIAAGSSKKKIVSTDGFSIIQEYKSGSERVVKYLPYPFNYGFLPKTLESFESGGDGDALDVILIGRSVEEGIVVKSKVIGIIYMIDKNEIDNKILATTLDTTFEEVNSINDLRKNFPGIIEIIQLWLENYKGGFIEITNIQGRKNANNYILNSKNSYKKKIDWMETRLEKKWKLDKKYLYNLINILKFSKFKFINQHDPRWINSIYFDDFHNNSIKQNLDGNLLKEKYRFRWYGEEKCKKNIFLEIKKKNGYTTNKLKKKILIQFNKVDETTLNLLKKKMEEYMPSKINLIPSAITRYYRQYFISSDKKIRATIDSNISYRNIGFGNLLNNKILDNDLVLELKYNSFNDTYVRNNLKNISLRLSKNSKFVNSFFQNKNG